MALILVVAGHDQQVGWAQVTPHIASVAPTNPSLGQMLVLTGTGFGTAPGPRWVSLKGVRKPSSSIFVHFECPLPIVDWREDRILALLRPLPDEQEWCNAGEHHLAIRDMTAGDWVNGRESNVVTIAVQEPPPPARRGDGPLDRGRVDFVHPSLASPGQAVDLYGDFPNPSPVTDRIALAPSGALVEAGSNTRMLETLEISRRHKRVRLPRQDMPAGEYLVIPGKADGRLGDGERLVIRSTEPAAWEHASELRGGSPVSFRLVNVVKNVGLGGEELDVLGLNFGPTQSRRAVYLLTDSELAGLKFDLVHGPGSDFEDSTAPLHGIPRPLRVQSWSDTRVRLFFSEGFASGEAEQGRDPFPTGAYNVIMTRVREPSDDAHAEVPFNNHWSNALHVTFR